MSNQSPPPKPQDPPQTKDVGGLNVATCSPLSECPFDCVMGEVESDDGIHRKACPLCGPGATPETIAIKFKWAGDPSATGYYMELEAHSLILEQQRNKYASELQTLCDMIIGGENVTAPFREVVAKLANLLENA